jgi:UPF0755 protein
MKAKPPKHHRKRAAPQATRKMSREIKKSPQSQAGRVLRWALLSLTALLAFACYLFALALLPMGHQAGRENVELDIEAGSSVRQIISSSQEAGLDVNASYLYWLIRLSGQAKDIKAGSYEISNQVSPWDFLQKITRGDETLKSVTLVEGWNFHQFRNALNKAEGLKHDSSGLSDVQIMQKIGFDSLPAEGHFYPDTYTFGKNTSDFKVLMRAKKAMDHQLQRAWEARAPQTGSTLLSPEEALTLASIVEKETGAAKDRAMISSVFHNRLKIGMPLQTDPTVIYGMGDAFNGNLTKKDLRADHPWNTYTRLGLPPTAISMPGKAALNAALHPETSQALYFVAKGDGSSYFSESLEEHNHAVNRYQRHLN